MGGVTKPFLELSGRPLLQRSMQPFLERADVHWVVVALPADLAAAPPHWLSRARWRSLYHAANQP